ncbi:MAG: alpha/beta fold hydrolase [Gammaproteobacteria bacterium]|jgi:pimeloyl-ACP methyl ester carboxylesterase/class 3 adenylate cyclase
MIYRFDGFSIDDTTFEVWRGDTRLEAQPQVIELLLMLIERRDRVVSREEIFEIVWKNRVVSDTTLSSRIKSARKLLGDDGARQKYIRTLHGRGFRFCAALDADREAAPKSTGREAYPAAGSAPPATRYARSGNVHIAYQQFGKGPIDLVFVPGFVSHIDNYWALPALNDWLTALGRLARVVMFDKRGTGLSDTVAELPGVDVRMDDVRAVMDAVGLDSACIMGISEGGSLASLFAAMHPERCDGLILYGAFASFRSWFATREDLQGLFDYVETAWGSGSSLPRFAPSVGDDPEFIEWWGKFERLGATPGAVRALMEMNSQIDITEILPSIRVPTLVIHRSEDVLIDIEAGRLLGSAIPGARYVELPGADHLPWTGDIPKITEAIGEFLQVAARPVEPDTVLATVIFIDASSQEVGGDEGLENDIAAAVEHHRKLYRGRKLGRKGAVGIYSFDGPARAIHCALEILNRLWKFDLRCRAGIHIGEIPVDGGMADNQTVSTARELCELARPGQILVSRTITDLVAGSGIEFEELAPVRLESLDRDWPLFRVER